MIMITADNNIDEEYVEWILRKEMFQKLSQELWNEYLHIFGDILEENYRWKSACKYLQKSIAYCVEKRKVQEEIDREEMEQIVRIQMEKDLQDWHVLREQIERSKRLKFVSSQQLDEIQSIFEEIINKLQSNESLLYEKAKEAYLNNDMKTLWQINDNLSFYKRKNYSFMEDETKRLKREVFRMKDRWEPYSILLDSPQRIQKTYKKIQDDTRSYKYYHKHLKQTLRQHI